MEDKGEHRRPLHACSFRTDSLAAPGVTGSLRVHVLRRNILSTFSSQASQHPPDPWAEYRQRQAKSSNPKGAGKGKKPTRESHSSSSDALIKEFNSMRDQLSSLTTRVDRQDGRIDALESTIEKNHSEVMQALMNLTLASTADSSTAKRSPEVTTSPLKALTGGKPPKQPKS